MERPATGLEGLPTSKFSGTRRRAVILEDHPAIGAVLEHLLSREGYAVELLGEGSRAEPGAALLLAGDAEHSGLHVFEVRDAPEALKRIFAGEPLKDFALETGGIRAFVPVPFGSGDVLRVVRAVSGFDRRRRGAGGQENTDEHGEGR